MNKTHVDDCHNPRALLMPGTVPLPVHNIVTREESSDSEDNLPTIDFDALKVPGHPETSFQNIMSWRGATPRLKAKEDTGSGPIARLLDPPESVSTVSSESTEDSSSESDDTESDSSTSSNSDSTKASSPSVSSGSDEENSTARKDEPQSKVRGDDTQGRNSQDKVVGSGSHVSHSSSSSHSRTRSRRRRSFSTINYEPGSLKLRLSAFDRTKATTSDAPPPISEINSAQISEKPIGVPLVKLPPLECLPVLNGICDKGHEAKTEGLVLSSSKTPETRDSEPISGTRRITRQQMKHSEEEATSTKLLPLKNGFVVLHKSDIQVTESTIVNKVKGSELIIGQPQPFFSNNKLIVPLGQTSQLTDSVTVTRVSAPTGSPPFVTGEKGTRNFSINHQQHQKKHEQLSDPVLYLSKKTNDLTIFPISPDKNRNIPTSFSKSPSPKVVIMPTNSGSNIPGKNEMSSPPPAHYNMSNRLPIQNTSKEPNTNNLFRNPIRPSLTPNDSIALTKFGCMDIEIRLPIPSKLSIYPIVRNQSNLNKQLNGEVTPDKDKVNNHVPSGRNSLRSKACEIIPAKVDNTVIPTKRNLTRTKTEPRTANSHPTSAIRTRRNKLSIFTASANSVNGVRKKPNAIHSSKYERNVMGCYTNCEAEVSLPSITLRNCEKTKTKNLKTEDSSRGNLSNGQDQRMSLDLRNSRQNLETTPPISQNFTLGTVVKTKAAKKFIPTEPIPFPDKEEKVLEQLVKLSKIRKRKKSKNKNRTVILKTKGSIVKSKRRKIEPVPQMLVELCNQFDQKLSTDDSRGSVLRRLKKSTLPFTNKEGFAFEMKVYKNLTPSFLHVSHVKRPQEVATSKSAGSRGAISSGATGKRKRTILPRTRSNICLDGQSESTADLQKLPLKKRHGHGQHHYDGSAYDESSPDDSFTFGGLTIYPTIIPSISTSATFLNGSSRGKTCQPISFADLKTKEGTREELNGIQKLKDTGSKRRTKSKNNKDKSNRSVSDTPVQLSESSTNKKQLKIPSFVAAKTEPSDKKHSLRLREKLPIPVPRPIHIKEEDTLIRIEDSAVAHRASPISVSTSDMSSKVDITSAKTVFVDVNPEDPADQDAIDIDVPLEIIDKSETEDMSIESVQLPVIVVAPASNENTSPPISTKRKRKANRTGFPNVKRKKRKLEAANASRSSEELEKSEESGKQSLLVVSTSDVADEDLADEEQQYDDFDLQGETGFSASLTERVKIRRRNSMDAVTKEEREQILNGTLVIPGVVPSFMDVPNPPLVMPYKNNYLKAGLLSDYFKKDPRPSPRKESMSSEELAALHKTEITQDMLWPVCLPLGLNDIPTSGKDKANPQEGEAFIDFKLPYDIWCYGVIETRINMDAWLLKEENRRSEERERLKLEAKRRKSETSVGIIRKSKFPMPAVTPDSWNFKRLRSNSYYGFNKPPISAETDQKCECKDGDFKCSSDDCLNRLIFTECPPSCGEKCMNRRIQKHDWAPELRRFMTEDKGFGVKSMQLIKKGDFILEYVGEVVSAAEFRRRMLEVYANDTHHYCLQLDASLVIDGHRSGGEGRFVNHSCEPNCEMQKWSVNGLFRMALFALRDIPMEEELSYDYNFSLYNETEGQPCYCNSENCRGVIGGKSKTMGKDGSRRKNLTGLKGVHPAGDMIFRGNRDSSAKIKVLSRKEIKFIRTSHAFLPRNYEKIRRMKYRTADEDEVQSDRIEKIMSGWASRYRVGSTKNKPLVFIGESAKVVRLAKMAQAFFELYKHVTAAKDTSGRCISEPFMEYPPKRMYPVFHSVIVKTKLQGFVSIEKNILRAGYKTIQALEEDMRIVLTTFAKAYETEKPETTALVERVKKIYKEAKQKAIQTLEPFIVNPAPNNTITVRRLSINGSDSLDTLPLFAEPDMSSSEDVVRCICGTYSEEGTMVQCEKCLVWQHCDCVNWPLTVSSTKKNSNSPPKIFESLGRRRGRKPKNPINQSEQITPQKEFPNVLTGPNDVEIYNGVVVGVADELPIMDVKEEAEFSTMDTQPLSHSEVTGVNFKESQSPSYYCELCEARDVAVDIPISNGDDDKGNTFFMALHRKDGFVLRQNDTVYILRALPQEKLRLPDGTKRPQPTYKTAGPLVKEECDIFRIETLLKDKNGNCSARGFNYLRPHETHHEPTRRFYPNEILKSPIYENIPIDTIHGKCWVLDTATYCKGRPKGCVEDHVYICDYRVNKNATSFDKVGKRSQIICTKQFAFNFFVDRIKIHRNIHPHGPPSPDFKIRPTVNVVRNGEKSKCRKGIITDAKYKLKEIEAEKQKRRETKGRNLNDVVGRMRCRIPEFISDPVDLSHLLIKSEMKRKPKPFKLS